MWYSLCYAYFTIVGKKALVIIIEFLCLHVYQLLIMSVYWDGDLCCVLSCSVVSDSLRPMQHGLPGFSVHGISQTRQEYWSGLPSPSLGDLPNPGVEATPLASPALAGRFFIKVSSGYIEFLCRVF